MFIKEVRTILVRGQDILEESLRNSVSLVIYNLRPMVEDVVTISGLIDNNEDERIQEKQRPGGTS